MIQAAPPRLPPERIERDRGGGDQSPMFFTRSAYPVHMPRGRHSQPEPPRSDASLMVAAVVLAALVITAVWVAPDDQTVSAGVTGLVALVLVVLFISNRTASRQAERYWNETVQQRREALETRRELAELRSQHVELLLEVRSMREEALQLSQEATRIAADDAEQRALMRQMLQPRVPALDPVYPSLHLPLVRAAFATQVPAAPTSPPRTQAPGLQRDSTSGGEAQPPRQLLDLTASEIARLRPAN